jgi:hypothetical protein
MRALRQRLIVALLCSGLISLASLPARASLTTGAIQGYVTDAAGHGLVGVTVTAASPSGEFRTTSVSSGFYSLNGLPLDTFTLTFFKDGYQAVSVPGIATAQDLPNRVSRTLSTGVRSLSRVTVRGAASLVQPAVTSNTYVVSQQRLSDINGTPQDLNALHAVNALPGVTADPLGFPTIRAGAENDVGYEIDGVDNTQVATGEYVSTLTFNGSRSVQLSTGGYDVSNGNTNSGVINQVIKRGTYPAQGRATLRINDPVFGHELSFDYGGATPNNRFSYYFSFGGVQDAQDYGDRATPLPLLLAGTVFTSINDDVLNLFYHFGEGNKNELQFLTNIGALTASGSYLLSLPLAPYASNNGNVQAASDPFGFGQPATFQSDYMTLFPGQVAYQQNTNQGNIFTYNLVVDKINYKRQLTPASFVEVRGFRTYLDLIDWSAYHVGSFSDYLLNVDTSALGEAFDYSNQLGSKNELSIGGDGVYNASDFFFERPSLEPSFEPLEALGCPALAAYLRSNSGLPGFPNVSTSGVGGCYIGSFNNAINSAFATRGFPNPDLSVDAGHAPLTTYVDDTQFTTDPVHRWDLWAKDRWQPNARLTITFGLRWDKETIALPSNAAQLNTTYYFDDSGNLVTLPGQPIGSDVTQPQQISPRFAASFDVDPRDALRLSYGKTIEFVPLSFMETAYRVPTSLQSCTISSGCFIPLPGGPSTPTCCTNHITNLYQQTLLDLNTNVGKEYTPLLPQTAVSADLSYEHDFGAGLELRLTPYYRKGSNYAVGSAPLLFVLPSGKQVFGPVTEANGGINQTSGIEFALQRNSAYGFSGLLGATYDNTIANYDADYFPTVNSATLAARHFFHVTYVAPLNGTINLVYNTRKGLYAATTISYESGYRYGVGKKVFVFDPQGEPVQVLNTDLTSGEQGAYYLTNPTDHGTEFAPNVVASRGTPEGNDPGTLFGPAIALVNLTFAQALGAGKSNVQVGLRVANLFGNYSPTGIPPNPYYGFSGFGNNGLPSGVNGNACAPGHSLACEPFQYNYSPFPYENEPSGPPRLYTFFISASY